MIKEFVLSSQIWPWRSRSINPKSNKNLNQGVLHFWSRFGDSSLSGWQVTARTRSRLTHKTDGRTGRLTNAGNDSTRRPKLVSDKNERTSALINCLIKWSTVCILTWRGKTSMTQNKHHDTRRLSPWRFWVEPTIFDLSKILPTRGTALQLRVYHLQFNHFMAVVRPDDPLTCHIPVENKEGKPWNSNNEPTVRLKWTHDNK